MSRRGLVLGTAAGAVTVAAGLLAGRAWDSGVLATGEGDAYEPWHAWLDGTGLLPLVNAATLAPSPHNTQPWRFALGVDRVDVHADPTRSTGAVDPYAREMHVGLGAAIENLTLSARAHGFDPTVEVVAQQDANHLVARVHLRAAPLRTSDLHRVIPERHTNRYPYRTDRTIAPAALAAMTALARPSSASSDRLRDVSLLWFTTPDDRARVSELLVSATEAFIADSAQIETDYSWFRQDWDAVQTLRDGITVDAAGLSPATRVLAKMLPAQSLEAMARSWLTSVRERHTATAAAYGVVVARDPARLDQRVSGGRLLERIHLWATANGLALHSMNQVTERADRERSTGIEPRFGRAIAELMPAGWQALTLFRAGHPTSLPGPSPRRAVAEVVIA